MHSPLLLLLWPLLFPVHLFSTAKKDRPFTLNRYGSLRHEASQSLGLLNRFGGYVFIVDGDGWVRWRGSGMATANELSVVSNLLKQMEKEKEKSKEKENLRMTS